MEEFLRVVKSLSSVLAPHSRRLNGGGRRLLLFRRHQEPGHIQGKVDRRKAELRRLPRPKTAGLEVGC